MSTDTLRTDVACYRDEQLCEVVDADFARELERENAKLREDINALIEIIDHANNGAWSNGNTHPDGFGPDEGEVLMSQLFSPIWERYRKPQ